MGSVLINITVRIKVAEKVEEAVMIRVRVIHTQG